MEEKDLIEHVKLAFEPKYRGVLFSNGTVVLIDNPTDKEKLLETALTQMKEIGPFIGDAQLENQYLRFT